LSLDQLTSAFLVYLNLCNWCSCNDFPHLCSYADDEEIDIDLDDPEVEAAATKIQAGFKGMQARREVKALVAAKRAAALAADPATSLGLEGSAEEEAAATRIQAGFRGHRARKELNAPKEVDIQDIVDDSLEDIDLEDPEVEAAAVKIQAGFKGMKGRQKAKAAKAVAQRKEIEESLGIDLDDPEVEAAATKIQAGYKGMQARKVAKAKAQLVAKANADGGSDGEVETEEAEESATATATADEDPATSLGLEGSAEEEAAAAKIQAGFRGHKVRKEMAAKRDGEGDADAVAGAEADAAAEDDADADADAATAEVTPAADNAAATAAEDPATSLGLEGSVEEEAAAAKIQAGFRGHKVRKEMAAKRDGDGDVGAGEAAATTEEVPAVAGSGDEGGAAVVAAADDAQDDPLAKIKAVQESHPNNLGCKHFDESYYQTLDDDKKARLLAILKQGYEVPDSSMGCYAMQPSDYDEFKPFFSKVLAEYHNVGEDARHVNSWSLEGIEGLPEGGRLDLAALGLPALSMRVRVARNLVDFPLPGAMTLEQRVTMEAKLVVAFEALAKEPEFGGEYYSITPGHANFIDEEKYKQLVADHIMFKDMAADPYLVAAGIASDWPHGRGCFVSSDKQFIVWVGEEDHLRIMCMQTGTVLNEVFDRLQAAIEVFSAIEGISFKISADYGVVTSCPTNLGTGMRASVHIPIPNLTADGTDTKAKEICKPIGLSVRGAGGEHTAIGSDGTCDISPSNRFCITEAEIIAKLYNGLRALKEEESSFVANAAAE
jgi:creatine kinase